MIQTVKLLNSMNQTSVVNVLSESSLTTADKFMIPEIVDRTSPGRRKQLSCSHKDSKRLLATLLPSSATAAERERGSHGVLTALSISPPLLFYPPILQLHISRGEEEREEAIPPLLSVSVIHAEQRTACRVCYAPPPP